MSSIRRVALPSLVLVGSFVVGLGILEVGLRLVEAWSTDGRPARSSSAGSRHPLPGRSDEPAFREPGPPGPKGEELRVLVTGDSFTWGTGVTVEEAYPHRLEEWLNALRPPQQIEVVALSRPGWNTQQEVRATSRALPDLDPDLLLLGYCLNDPEPSGHAARKRLQAPLLRRGPPSGLAGHLYRRSALVRLLFDRLENTRQRRAFSRYYQGLYEPGQGFERCVGALQRLSRDAERREIPALLVIFPVIDAPLGRYHYGDIHLRMESIGQQAGWSVLDLLPAYEGLDARQLVLEPFTDPHPSAEAHRIAAEAIGRYIAESGWLGLRPETSSRRRPLHSNG